MAQRRPHVGTSLSCRILLHLPLLLYTALPRSTWNVLNAAALGHIASDIALEFAWVVPEMYGHLPSAGSPDNNSEGVLEAACFLLASKLSVGVDHAPNVHPVVAVKGNAGMQLNMVPILVFD